MCYDREGMDMSLPFSPDWCIAPSATLEDWMRENGMSARVLAVACAVDQERRKTAEGMIEDVLARRPLSAAHAKILERATAIPARFWLNYEHNYRAGLAAGLKDVTR